MTACYAAVSMRIVLILYRLYSVHTFYTISQHQEHCIYQAFKGPCILYSVHDTADTISIRLIRIFKVDLKQCIYRDGSH